MVGGTCDLPEANNRNVETWDVVSNLSFKYSYVQIYGYKFKLTRVIFYGSMTHKHTTQIAWKTIEYYDESQTESWLFIPSIYFENSTAFSDKIFNVIIKVEE